MAFVVGTVIGTGIYFKPAQVARMAPEPWQNLLLWAAGGFFALCGAVVYARLATIWPDSGGAYVYLRNCYGRWVASLLLAADVLLARPAAVGALATGLGLVWRLDPSGTIVLAVLTLLCLTVTQLLGRQATGGIQVLLTVLKLTPLAVIATVGMGLPHTSPAPPVLSSQSVLWGGGFLAVLWAYDGWYNIAILAGEVEHPERNLSRSLIGGVLIVTAVYLSLNGLLLAKLSHHQMVAEGLPFLALLNGSSLPWLGAGLKWCLTLALLATLNGTLACGPSMLSASGLDGHGDLQNTVRATLLFSGWCLGLLLTFAGLPSHYVLFDRLSEYTEVVVCVLSGLTVSCLFHLPRLGFAANLATRLAGLAFLAVDLTLVVVLAFERPGLALGGLTSVLMAGSALYYLGRR